MESQTLPKLPTIDFTKEHLKPGSSSWVEASTKVKFALEEYGCFVAVYHKVSIFESLEELFDLPTETKVLNTSDRPKFGYIGQHPLIPLYESMGIDGAQTLESVQAFTNIMWPNGNDHFCKTVHSYTTMASQLEQLVTRMVFESYGVGKYYESHVGSMTYLLRVMKYRDPKMGETNVGLNSHTDKTFLSILHQNEVNGLEVETKEGARIALELPPSSCVVIAGDAFLAWSNNRVHSPVHKVIMNGNESRYSIGLFSFHKGMIHIPEELVDEDHPLQFKSFDHLAMINFHASKEIMTCCAKAYCGV